ncbi:MAG: oxidoreductase [Acidiferrobacteraceae bacterium]|nr:oxidoreductase [Acidiferrobacteraceae bacterium]
MSFKAFRIHQGEQGVSSGFEMMNIDDLSAGEVDIRVQYSGINYKDALAATGKGQILRAPSLNGGIDLAGEVVASRSDRFAVGDKVMSCGAGLSETADGGFSEYTRVEAESLSLIPDGLTGKESMSIGTAGFTAALALVKMELNGQEPGMGPIVVTGATGGVGSFAIDLLSKRKYEIVALTGKKDCAEYLSSIGAAEIVDRHSVVKGGRPLERGQWGGAVDNVGGPTLAWITRTVKHWGNIASIGLAGGVSLETTVMPFILRGVSLHGINSNVPRKLREATWQRLASDLKPQHINEIVRQTINFDDLPGAFNQYIEGRVIGRTVVKIGE